jgi:hypothetical protein
MAQPPTAARSRSSDTDRYTAVDAIEACRIAVFTRNRSPVRRRSRVAKVWRKLCGVPSPSPARSSHRVMRRCAWRLARRSPCGPQKSACARPEPDPPEAGKRREQFGERGRRVLRDEHPLGLVALGLAQAKRPRGEVDVARVERQRGTDADARPEQQPDQRAVAPRGEPERPFERVARLLEHAQEPLDVGVRKRLGRRRRADRAAHQARRVRARVASFVRVGEEDAQRRARGVDSDGRLRGPVGVGTHVGRREEAREQLGRRARSTSVGRRSRSSQRVSRPIARRYWPIVCALRPSASSCSAKRARASWRCMGSAGRRGARVEKRIEGR